MRSPHYHLVPKDLAANLRWRRRLIEEAADDTTLRADLRQMCSEDLLFWVSTFCVAAGTPVVTDRGLVPIENVTGQDRVWDGEDWVSQDGACHMGRRSVIFAYEVFLTPDHKVMTTHGWQEAVHRHDRQEVRLPDSPPAGRSVQERSPSVDVQVRLRKGVEGGGHKPSPRAGEGVRLPEGRQSNPRSVWRSGSLHLGADAAAVREPEQSQLRQVRREGHTRLPPMGAVRKLPRRHGGSTVTQTLHRPHRQQWGLLPRELPVGDKDRAGEQHQHEPIHRHANRPNDCRQRREDAWDYDKRHAAKDGELAGGGLAFGETSGQAEVYDLLNCGPRQAFTVIDASGRPLLVHNCWTHAPKLHHKTPTYPFIPYPFQEDTFGDLYDAINDGHDIAIKKSRDMGASWMLLTAFTWFWLYRPDQNFLLVSRNEDYVDKPGNPKSLFWKIDYLLDNVPRWMLPVYTRAKLRLTNHSNDSCIDGESTTSDVGRGDRRTAIALDEFAAFDVNSGYKVMMATRDATNCRIFNSTPQGTGNAFYDVCESQDGIKTVTLHWTMHPEKAAGLYYDDNDKPRSPWYDNECARTVSRAEIGQELDVSFSGSNFQYFPQELIDECIKRDTRPAFSRGEVQHVATEGEFIDYVEHPSGDFLLWINLLVGGHPPKRGYSIGVDIATGTGASNTVISVGDNSTGELVGKYVSAHIRPEEAASLTAAIGRWFKDGTGRPAKLIWEAAGPGREFGAKLRELGYRNVYFRRNEVKANKRYDVEIPGWWPTKDTIREVLFNYRTALNEGRCINRDRDSLVECGQLIYEKGDIVHVDSLKDHDPSGARANHADRPRADALCWKLMSEYRQTKDNGGPKIPAGSLAHRRMLEAEREAKQNRHAYWTHQTRKPLNALGTANRL